MVSSSIAGTGHEVIIVGLLSGFTAQLYKFALFLLTNRKVNFRLLVQTGGMPSSHSSSMSSMATSVGLISGWTSVDFAIALGVALVVMYDAAGVRRAAGNMATILNQMTEDFYEQRQDKVPDRLRELLGHTPLQVLMGALLGIGLSFYMHHMLMS